MGTSQWEPICDARTSARTCQWLTVGSKLALRVKRIATSTWGRRPLLPTNASDPALFAHAEDRPD